MCADETAMHQPKTVHFIKTVYIMYPFLYNSNCVLYVRVKFPRLTLYRLVLELITRVKRGLNVFTYKVCMYVRVDTEIHLKLNFIYFSCISPHFTLSLSLSFSLGFLSICIWCWSMLLCLLCMPLVAVI